MLKFMASRVLTWPACLLLVITALPAADWVMVELDLPSGQHKIIDLSVSDRGIEVLTSQDKQVKDQSSVVDIPHFTLSLINPEGTSTAVPWDPTRSLPTDAVSTPSARSLLRLAGLTKAGVAGRAAQTLRGGPGMPRAFLSTPQERIWLPKPAVHTFEAPGAGLGVGTSQPVCVNAGSWIAGEWVLNFSGGSMVLPVVWIPDNIGGYQTAPLLTKKADYTRYQNLKIQDMAGSWIAGYYGPDERPTPFIITQHDGVAQETPAFNLHALSITPENGDPAFDIGVAVRIIKEQAMGWVARKDKPTAIVPAIWQLMPAFGAFESKLHVLAGTGSAAAVADKNVFVNAAGQVLVHRDGKSQPLKIKGTTFSWLVKHRNGVALARIHGSDRLAVIRLPVTDPTSNP